MVRFRVRAGRGVSRTRRGDLDCRGLAREATLRQALRDHARHHQRFYLALAVGAAAWLATAGRAPELRLVLAGDAFFASFLALVVPLLAADTPASIRERAGVVDVGNWAVLTVVVVVIAASIAAIFEVISHRAAPTWSALAALVGVPLGWLTLHTMAALRYAHQFYQRVGRGKAAGEARGLEFPGTAEPELADFFYFAFTIGMTAQTSDVAVRSAAMRRFVLVHAVISFFFNAVIIALAVSVAYGLAA
jgi:uncharacterized membrane protein